MSRIRKFMKGVKVLDLSRHLPGPLATLLMVDMGATVLKIEAPEGDEVRRLGPHDARGRPVYFETVTAGKQWTRLDLKSDVGRAEILSLIRDADVLVSPSAPASWSAWAWGMPCSPGSIRA